MAQSRSMSFHNTPPTREGDSGKAELGETIWSLGPTACLACRSPQCKGWRESACLLDSSGRHLQEPSLFPPHCWDQC